MTFPLSIVYLWVFLQIKLGVHSVDQKQRADQRFSSGLGRSIEQRRGGIWESLVEILDPKSRRGRGRWQRQAIPGLATFGVMCRPMCLLPQSSTRRTRHNLLPCKRQEQRKSFCRESFEIGMKFWNDQPYRTYLATSKKFIIFFVIQHTPHFPESILWTLTAWEIQRIGKRCNGRFRAHILCERNNGHDAWCAIYAIEYASSTDKRVSFFDLDLSCIIPAVQPGLRCSIW